MLVALLVSPVAAQTIDPINGFAIEPFNPACTLDGGPTSIIAGRDGNLWFTERFGNKIGRIAPTSGLITEFCQVLTAGNPSGITGSPRGITVGPDGNIWFAEVSGVIGRITSAGVITEFASDLIRDSGPFAITAGRDGNLWFTEFFGNRIAQITPAGVVTEFPPLPNPAPLNGPRAITAGPDGNLWFTEYYGNRIGRVTPAGVITEFPPLSSPTSLSGPDSITVGPDGNLWFTEDSGNKIGRITPAGVITELPLPPHPNWPPNCRNRPLGITAPPARRSRRHDQGPDGVGRGLLPEGEHQGGLREELVRQAAERSRRRQGAEAGPGRLQCAHRLQQRGPGPVGQATHGRAGESTDSCGQRYRDAARMPYPGVSCASASSRSFAFWILPEPVIGNSATKITWRGILKLAILSRQ